MGDSRSWNLDAWTGDVVHTPCSTIYLPRQPDGDALKVRKPVNLGYLDFSTLRLRQRFSEEEVRLNADLAPGVYKRVVPVVAGPAGREAMEADQVVRGGKEIVDYAVVMRRLPAGGMLPGLLSSRRLNEAEHDAIVTRLAAFHSRCDAGPEVAKLGTPEEIRTEITNNLAQSEGLPGVSLKLLEWLKRWMAAELERQWPVLTRRVKEGRIREGHGDLHAGNICFDPGAQSPANPTGLVIYDRLEFRKDFRCTDVAAELACLASTLDAHGRPEDADDLIAKYAAKTGDPELMVLQPLYRAHYAIVRAKVHAMRSAQRDCPASERAGHETATRARLVQAAGYALPACLVLTCGLPGSGKSFASRAVSLGLRATIARADEIRKDLAGLKPTDRGGPELYTPEMSIKTYAAVLEKCDARLRAGESVIADATFRSRTLREPFLILARSLGQPVVIVYCRADEAETLRRLESRSAAGADASDADAVVYQKMRAGFEPPTPAEAPVVEMAAGVSTSEMMERLVLSIGVE